MTLVCESLGVSRSQLTARIKQIHQPKKACGRSVLDDTSRIEQIRTAVTDLPSHGYRRVWALLRRQAERQAQPPRQFQAGLPSDA